MKRIEQELFDSDCAEAKERVGDGVCGSDLARSPAQRQADALVEMARRAMAVPAGARLPAPLFGVFVGYETFAGRMCELSNGPVVSPGSLVPWLDEAWAERVVFESPDRIKNVGVRRRMFDGATRRAVEVRDRECFHEFCEITAEDCEIDRVEPWATGGLTVDDNGRVACGFHNRGRDGPDESRSPPASYTVNTPLERCTTEENDQCLWPPSSPTLPKSGDGRRIVDHGRTSRRRRQ